METVHYATFGGIGLITAIVAGRWTLELGFSQVRQLCVASACALRPATREPIHGLTFCQ
jgi:hypothetical protein